ncbi:unnamed protein product [Thelazia callipaeda]|uniref:WD_REPEATS_REGION domain-containing protein n=1 Tax=Thelazia callipaeda TaxID=103827 RepID=A0A0N5CNV1_THECL|nr:unnamed protein product [Thelazia callipaeda]
MEPEEPEEELRGRMLDITVLFSHAYTNLRDYHLRVTPSYFKKLGEKLRNHQKYEQEDELSIQIATRTQSYPLDLNSGIRFSTEATVLQASEQQEQQEQDEQKGQQQEEQEEQQKLQEQQQQQGRHQGQQQQEQRQQKQQQQECIKEDSRKKSKQKKKNEGCRPVHSPSETKHITVPQDESIAYALSTTTFTDSTTSEILATRVKSISEFQDGIETDFLLDEDNILSILNFKNNPNCAVYELQNSSGCKIYVERAESQALIMSLDVEGRLLYISSNF